MSQLLTSTEATDASATLYDRHHDRIRGYCLGQLRHCEEADDAAQSTFLYAFASLQRGVAPRNELPWLFTIAHNVCRTRRRSLRRRSRLESAVDLDTLSESVGRDDPSCDELEGLGTALAAMPENQRRALLPRRHTSPPPRAAVQPAGALPQRAVVTATAATPQPAGALHPTTKGVARSAVAQKEATPATGQVSTPAAPASSSFRPSAHPAPA